MYVIAAVDQNWAIGKGGDQLCYLPADLRRFQALTTGLCYLPADLRRFQALTTGHPVILGRKTLATFPGGRPLKNRRNLILSRDPAFAPEGAEVFRSLEALRAAAPADSFVIGGASVYAALLDGCDTAYITKIGKLDGCDTAYITKIGRAWEGADAFFPNLDGDPSWLIAEEGAPLEHEGIPFRYVTYRRRDGHVPG